MEGNDYNNVSFKDRLVFAVKALWFILTGKDLIVVFFRDGNIYARCTPMSMVTASEVIKEVAENCIASSVLEDYKNLIEIPKYREN